MPGAHKSDCHGSCGKNYQLISINFDHQQLSEIPGHGVDVAVCALGIGKGKP